MQPITTLVREVNRACSGIRPVGKSGGLLLLLLMLVIAKPVSSCAQIVNACPPGFNDTPALPVHLDQADIASGRLSFEQIFNFGRKLFVTNFNRCDGAGRPADTGSVGVHGVGNPRPVDPLQGPRFTILSGPDSNSCASCHNEPEVGGGGSFHTNLFEQASDCDPVAGVMLGSSLHGNLSAPRPCRPPTTLTPTSTNNGFSHTFNERGSLGMFGSGAIELLGREMTADLRNWEAMAIAQAVASKGDVSVALQTKGVQFGMLIAHADGTVDTSGVAGVSPDLVVRPFGRKGQNKSIRHFSVQAFNRHLGIQPDEALEQLTSSTPDPDQDGVSNELTVGDMTAVVVFQAALPVPRQTQLRGAKPGEAERGEKLFAQVGCTGCHIPALPLKSTVYCEPNPLNTVGDFRDTSQQFCFDLQKTSGLQGNLVRAYTDLKRHAICDPTRDYDPTTNHFCDDVPITNTPATDNTGPGAAGVTDRPPYYQFLTAKLWDVGNSGPWGHRNDLDTIYEAIVRHGGEAAQSEAAYEKLSDSDQLAIVTFLKTLKMPIMENNPPPQEEGSPHAPNPGGTLDRDNDRGRESTSSRYHKLGFELAWVCAAALVLGATVVGRRRRGLTRGPREHNTATIGKNA